jgi:hypothetical protein
MPLANPTGHVLTRDIDLFKLWNKWTLIPVLVVILVIRTTEIITHTVVWGYCKPRNSAAKRGSNKLRFFITTDSLQGTNVDDRGGGRVIHLLPHSSDFPVFLFVFRRTADCSSSLNSTLCTEGISLFRRKLCLYFDSLLSLDKTKKLNSVALFRKRTIPIERPPLVGEVSSNLCG